MDGRGNQGLAAALRTCPKSLWMRQRTMTWATAVLREPVVTPKSVWVLGSGPSSVKNDSRAEESTAGTAAFLAAPGY